MRKWRWNVSMLPVIAVAWVLIGGVGTVFLPWPAISAWRTSHGGGHAGAFTLVEQLGCDRNQPPACGWFGDFTSDDGTVVRHHLELHPGIPPGAAVGQSVRARYAGGSRVFLEGDTSAWKVPVAMFAAFLAAFLAGLGMCWYCFSPFRSRSRSTGDDR